MLVRVMTMKVSRVMSSICRSCASYGGEIIRCMARVGAIGFD